jgi:hypothetical protein
MRTRHKLTALLGTGLMIASLSSFAAELTFNLTPEGHASVKNTPTEKVTEDSGIVYVGGQLWGYFTRTTTQLNMDSNHRVEEITIYARSVRIASQTINHQLRLSFQVTLQGVTNGDNFGNLGQVSSTEIPVLVGAMYKWGPENDGNTIIITF